MTCLEKMYDYNQTRPSQMEKRAELIKEMFAEAGEGCYIEPPFYANWGGRHVHLGNHVYANFGLTCVDDTHIYIGDHTMMGPNVNLATANHPLLPELRESIPVQSAHPHRTQLLVGCWRDRGAGCYHWG